jgi:phosphoserine phosphatase RsbU/P
MPLASDLPDTGLALISVAGPTAVAVSLTPPGPLVIGRRPTHALFLPDPASRDHAQIVFEASDEGENWFIIDTNSRHGTRLNGVILISGRKYPLCVGDLIEIRPWTFELIDRADRSRDASTLHTVQDEPSEVSRIDRIGTGTASRSQQRLALLLECAKRIHAADDEQSLAQAVLDGVVMGTGFANAALLRPTGAGGDTVTVIGARGSIAVDSRHARLSRSLIQRASGGEPVRLNTSALSSAAAGASVVDLGINEALCVPLMLGSAVAGFLYLDNRQGDAVQSSVAPDAAEFAVGIAQLAAMATANIRRLDLERRLTRLDAELAATAEAQRWILPPRRLRFGRYACVGESRPGHTVSGDFYDVVPLPENRFAVTLGDVAGKGIAASVLMTAAQGYLHAMLAEHGEPGRAATNFNRFICPRCPDRHFITLWIGVFDTEAHTLQYVDAGHGLATMIEDGQGVPLREAGGPPVGLDAECVYESATVHPGAHSRILIVSDGLVEQCGRRVGAAAASGVKSTGGLPTAPADGSELTQFGLNAVLDVAMMPGIRTGEQLIASLFHAVQEHAAQPMLADDATAVLVWMDEE